jgi:uncharacterized protein YndB with AHSA1/START domain
MAEVPGTCGTDRDLEVVEPERLVWRYRDVDLVVTITLRDLGGRTEMTCHVVGETGGDQAVAGWSSSFDKLAASLARERERER